MDESEKRRERLRAIRVDADSQPSSPSPAPPPHSSTPPLPLQPLTGESTPPPPLPRPRFDHYTNPMPAFSTPKPHSGGGHNPRSSPVRSPSPMHRPPSAGSRNYHTASPSHQFPFNQCVLATPFHQFQVNQFPDQSGCGSWRSQGPFASPFLVSGATPVTNLGGWNGHGGSSGHGFPPNPRGGYANPVLGRGGSPVNNSGRNSYTDNSGRGSPHSFSGRGRSWQSGGSHSPGRSGGRGRGFNGSTRREMVNFYSKAMVEDPWHELKPVIGNILVPSCPGFWFPKSLAKPEESRTALSSRSSLAESLALSFEEAIDETIA